MSRLSRLNPPQRARDAASTFLTQSVADGKYMTSGLSPLYGYFSKLALAKTGRCEIVMMGDSIMEGQGAPTVPQRWVNLTQDKMRATLAPSAVGGEYVPARYVASPTNGGTAFPAWTFAGSTANATYGIGFKSTQLNLSATATITRYCTSAKVFLRLNGSGQTVSISTDGGTAVAVTIDALTKTWTSPALAAGNHTFVITSTAGAPVLEGAYFYNGDEAAGLALWDGSHSGAVMSGHMGTLSMEQLPSIGASLLVLGCLTNDSRTASGGYSSATYATNIATAVTNARAAVPNIPILFMTPYKALGTLIEPWTNYTDKIKSLVAATPYTAFYDMSNTIPDLTSDPYGFLVDSVHPTARGHAMLAQLAATSALIPR